MNIDIFGQAIIDFFEDQYSEDIIVSAPDFDDDHIPVPYLFRSYDEMPILEQKALQLCRGKVLDVGCGAGSHSLYLEHEKGLKVDAIDTSEGAIEICNKRGVTSANIQDFYTLENETYDTLLLLMNGSGIIGKLDQIDHFFTKAKQLLAPHGQILIDSSDIAYLFTDEDGGFWVDASAGYYGEMKYQLSYKKNQSNWFDWLYLDYNTLQNAANANGFVCELVTEGEHYDYLAKLSLTK